MARRIDVSDQEIVSLYNELKSPSRVASHFGIGSTTVERRLAKHGVKRVGQRGLPRKLPRSIAKEYENGASMNELARKHGVVLPTVAEALRRAGVKSRPRGGALKVLPPATIKRVVRMYVDEKLSQEKIAAVVGSSQTVISRYLRSEGIDTRTGGSSHASWKGGTIRMSAGYVGVYVYKNDPMRVMAGATGYVMEHRLVVARYLGRPLERHETIHHINGIKTDNIIENLQLRSGQHGSGVVHRCQDCGSTNIKSTRIS